MLINTMKMKYLAIIFLALMCSSFSKKEYVKTYYSNGNMKEEGWLLNGKKTEYWFYYYESGSKRCEGHYKNNLKVNWWVFYDSNGKIIKKAEFNQDVQNGFTIVYKNEEIVLAEKYKNGIKLKSWKTLSDFKKDNANLF